MHCLKSSTGTPQKIDTDLRKTTLNMLHFNSPLMTAILEMSFEKNKTYNSIKITTISVKQKLAVNKLVNKLIWLPHLLNMK